MIMQKYIKSEKLIIKFFKFIKKNKELKKFSNN